MAKKVIETEVLNAAVNYILNSPGAPGFTVRDAVGIVQGLQGAEEYREQEEPVDKASLS
jgi:hypothetical protein